MPETLSHLGRKTAYRIDGDSLVWTDDKGGEQRLALADVRQVRLAKLGGMSLCDVRCTGGKTHCLSNDDRATGSAYARFVRALHEQLVERGGIEFVRGSWLIVSIIAGVGALVCVLGLAIHQGWFTVPSGLQGKATLIVLLGLATLVLGPLLVWRSRPRGYDPRDPPRDLVE